MKKILLLLAVAVPCATFAQSTCPHPPVSDKGPIQFNTGAKKYVTSGSCLKLTYGSSILSFEPWRLNGADVVSGQKVSAGASGVVVLAPPAYDTDVRWHPCMNSNECPSPMEGVGVFGDPAFGTLQTNPYVPHIMHPEQFTRPMTLPFCNSEEGVFSFDVTYQNIRSHPYAPADGVDDAPKTRHFVLEFVQPEMDVLKSYECRSDFNWQGYYSGETGERHSSATCRGSVYAEYPTNTNYMGGPRLQRVILGYNVSLTYDPSSNSGIEIINAIFSVDLNGIRKEIELPHGQYSDTRVEVVQTAVPVFTGHFINWSHSMDLHTRLVAPISQDASIYVRVAGGVEGVDGVQQYVCP